MIFDDINLALSFTVILNFLLGVVIYLQSSNKRIKIIYSLNILFIICWSVAMIIYRSVSQEMAMSACMLLYASPLFIASTFLFFTYFFPYRSSRKTWLHFLFIFGGNLFLLVLTFIPDVIIKEVNVVSGYEKEIVFGKYFLVYVVYLHVYFMYAFYRLLRRYYSAIKISKAQIAYLLVGYAVSTFFSFITNLIMPWMGNFSLNWIGQIFTVIMVLFTSYAIVAHRLMNIKLVIRRYTINVLSLFSLVSVVIIIDYLYDRFVHYGSTLFFYIMMVLAIISFSEVKKKYSKFASKYFFSSLYDSQKVITELSDKLRLTLGAQKMYELIYETLNNALHLKSFGIVIFNKENHDYEIKFNRGFVVNSDERFDGNIELRRLFTGRDKSIVTEEVRRYNYNEKSKKLIDIMIKYKIDVITPLNVKNRPVGMLIIGRKESNDMYTNEDLELIEIVASQTVIAIENAVLYEESLNFNIKLEQEIKKAVSELVAANRKLKRLDKAKSEFISIASHQLRTPLTVIKGYISMILDGNFGKVRDEKKGPLKKVYESNERLIGLVENLLNISRIESGRLEYNYHTSQLSELVESVCDELITQAEKKGIKLVYKKPKEKLPLLKIDEEKIRQVVLNLIDNAIKYTHEGAVVVDIACVNKQVRMRVKDSGIGISKDDLPNLFKKFSRGTGTSLIHTEGTGLGLYVAKRMIKAHKGEIWAESDGLDEGSSFCFRLPVG